MFKHVAAVGKSNARKDQVAPFDDGKGGQQGLLPLAPVSSIRPIWVTDQDLETAEREVIAYAQRNGIRLPDDPAQRAVAAAMSMRPIQGSAMGELNTLVVDPSLAAAYAKRVLESPYGFDTRSDIYNLIDHDGIQELRTKPEFRHSSPEFWAAYKTLEGELGEVDICQKGAWDKVIVPMVHMMAAYFSTHSVAGMRGAMGDYSGIIQYYVFGKFSVSEARHLLRDYTKIPTRPRELGPGDKSLRLEGEPDIKFTDSSHIDWVWLLRLGGPGRHLTQIFYDQMVAKSNGKPLPKLPEPVSNELLVHIDTVMSAHRDVIAEAEFRYQRGGYVTDMGVQLNNPPAFNSQLYVTPTGLVELMSGPNIGYAVDSKPGDGHIRMLPASTSGTASVVVVQSLGTRSKDSLNPVADYLLKAASEKTYTDQSHLATACEETNGAVRAFKDLGTIGANAMVITINNSDASGEVIQRLRAADTAAANAMTQKYAAGFSTMSAGVAQVEARMQAIQANDTRGYHALAVSTVGGIEAKIIGRPEDQYTPRGSAVADQIGGAANRQMMPGRAAGFQDRLMAFNSKLRSDYLMASNRFVIVVSPAISRQLSNDDLFEIADRHRAYPTDQIAHRILTEARERGVVDDHQFAVVVRTYALPGSTLEQLSGAIFYRIKRPEVPALPYVPTQLQSFRQGPRPGDMLPKVWTTPVAPGGIAVKFGRFVAAREVDGFNVSNSRFDGIAGSAVKGSMMYQSPWDLPPVSMDHTTIQSMPWGGQTLMIHASGGGNFYAGLRSGSVYMIQTASNYAPAMATALSSQHLYNLPQFAGHGRVFGKDIHDLRRMFVSYVATMDPKKGEKLTATAIDFADKTGVFGGRPVTALSLGNARLIRGGREIHAGKPTYMGEGPDGKYAYPTDQDLIRTDLSTSAGEVVALMPETTLAALGGVGNVSKHLSAVSLGKSGTNEAERLLGVPRSQEDGVVLLQLV